jgi:hypothetical protein
MQVTLRMLDIQTLLITSKKTVRLSEVTSFDTGELSFDRLKAAIQKLLIARKNESMDTRVSNATT